MEDLQYVKEYKIPVYEIGADGMLNLHSLFNYFQDIASEHAVKLRFGKDDLLKENRFWVLSRMVADIVCWPGWEQTIIVKTWPRGTDKLFALRDYEVYFPDGKPVAAASSSWLVVDKTTRRIRKPDTLLTRFNTDTQVKSSLGRNAGKLESLTDYDQQSESFRVNISELDINMHTNNVMYIKWVADIYDMKFRLSHLPVSVEINYLSESRKDDEVCIRTATDKNNRILYNHSVIRTVDNTELCRLRIGWRDCRH
jgi:medium-chain acyl-[acyl-carrier-protein] hydrolase